MEDLTRSIATATDPNVSDIERCRAFEAVVKRFQDMAFGYAYSLLGDRHLAEDAAQEALITAWEHLGSLRRPDAFPGWFRKIVEWQCQWHRRKRAGRPRLTQMSEDLPSLDDDPYVLVEHADVLETVQKSIGTLGGKLRDVTYLHYIGDYSQKEISKFLGVPEGTVRKRLFDARSKLRVKLLRDFGEDIAKEAPSRNRRFGGRVMKWVRPDFTTEQGDFAGGEPEQVWDMLLAAVEGDMDRVVSLLKKNPALAYCNWAYYHPVNFAVREGHTDVVRALLDAGADPTVASGLEYHDKPLDRARDQGLDDIVVMLERAIEDRYRSPLTGQRLLDTVAEDDIERVTAILDDDPNLVHSGDERGRRALHIAVERKNLSMTQLLLDRGADMEGVRWDGRKALHLAVYEAEGHDNRPDPLLSGYLIARGADYSITVAAALGDERRVRALLASDASQANDQDTCQCSPLFSAARGGHAEIVKMLLEHGALPNAPEQSAPRGHALYEAAAGNHLDIAQLLLDSGADPNAIVESSGNPLTQALGKHQNAEMANLLYRNGAVADISLYVLMDNIPVVGELLAADPGLANFGGDYGVLCMAAGFAKIEIIEMLIRAGADLNRPWYANNYMGYAFRRHKGWGTDGTKLRSATDQVEVLNLFFDKGADPNLANWHGVTYLHKLASAGNNELVRLLISRGADINVVDDEWRSTPLGWAARMGQTDTVRLLLELGADSSASGADWATPAARARKAGHMETLELLK
jgi:RNA polymerase sigma factor (sigma-70 family)